MAEIVSSAEIEAPLNLLINTVVDQRTPTQNNEAANTPAKYG